MPSRVYQPNFTGGILGEGMYARSDTTKYATGVKDAVNMLIRPQGGMANRAGLRLASGFDTSGASNIQWSIPFTLTNQTAVALEFSDSVFRVIFEAAYVLDSSFTARDVTAVSYADPGTLTMASSGDASAYAVGELVYLDDPAGDFTLGEQVLRVSGIASDVITFEVYDGTEVDLTAGAGFWGALGAGAVLEKVYSKAHPYDLADVPFLRFAQDNLDLYIVGRGYAPRKLTFTATDNWTLATHSFTPAIGSPASVTVTPDTPASATVKYAVSAIAEDTLEEGTATQKTINNSNLPASDNVVTWPAVTSAVLYNVYRENAGGFGYIGTTAGLSFTDNNIAPDQSTRPKSARNPFGSTDNYPGVVNFVEQRLTMGGTNDNPQLIEASKTGAFTNFSVSYPSQPDDGLRFRLRTRERNDIRAMVSGLALYVFTSAAEWVVSGNENEGILTPTSIVPRPASYFGSYDIEPLVVGDTAFFVEPSGNVVRDFLLTLNPNAEDQSRELTLLVQELFENREITSWTYAGAPDRTAWVTLSDGSLLSLCYMAEHDIWGWTRHVIGGEEPFVYQAFTLREGVRDALYVTVGRIINSVEVVMVERLDPRADSNTFEPFFLDSGLTYYSPGSPVDTLSGLMHLRGQTVSALVDGDVIDDLVVDAAGVVALGREGEYIHVGLPYRSYLETLPVDFEVDGLGSMQARFKAVGEVALSLKRSRGVSAGVRLESLNELVEWEPYMVGGPIPLQTRQIGMSVDSDWMRSATVFVVQDYPLPMTVLGVAPDWEAGE